MMHRWFRGLWWTWPWPSWFFYRLRLRLAWEYLPPERQAAYSEALRQFGAAGLSFAEASRAITQLARAAQEAWAHLDAQALVRERRRKGARA